MRLGVCYYPEHWPESMWEDDARRMKALGIEQVRIAEFAWSRIEPTPGEYDWGWLDRAIDVLGDAGLQVVMCTPTATPPKWLIDRHPDILPVGADGRPRAFGSRRHYDFRRLRISPPRRKSARRSPSVTASIRPSLIGRPTTNSVATIRWSAIRARQWSAFANG